MRTLVVTCPYWPLLAAGVRPEEPAAVVEANRVTVCSPEAVECGVETGMRRREAQSRCPSLQLVPPDPARDAREFERVLGALERVTPAVEIVRPGTCLFATERCVRFFGSEEAVISLTRTVVEPAASFGIGVAEGFFAAALAARQSLRLGRPVVTPVEGTPAFLDPLPIVALGRPELADLLNRLGIKTLGDFARLPVASVIQRFGPDGLLAHRQAAGLEERLFVPREPRIDLTVAEQFDPPTDRVDVAVFAGKALAHELASRLDEEGLTCDEVSILAAYEEGDELIRTWRLDNGLTAGAVAERVRWQLEGRTLRIPGDMKESGRHDFDKQLLVSGRSGELLALTLIPERVSPDQGRQLSFWGGPTEPGRRAARGVARLQGLMGPEAVLVAELKGGRGPGDQFRWISADGVDLLNRADAVRTRAPWPGGLPAPSPALVFSERAPVRLVGAGDQPLAVEQERLSAGPARLIVKGGGWEPVTGWAGPWPVKERWWDKPALKDLARLQVTCSGDHAYLVAFEKGAWWLEARYD